MRLIIPVFLLYLLAPAWAADDAGEAATIERLSKALEVPKENIHPSPAAGLYEVEKDHQFGYATADGKYLLRGNLVDVASGNDITDARKRADRLAALNALGDENMIEFAPTPPQSARYVVTVFTDVDCGYCQELHRHMADYNAAGIAIRYLFYPRTGIDTPSYYKAETVWCSEDRHKALTAFEKGRDLAQKRCDNPVQREYELGDALGVRGTPAMILPDGTLVQGYAPADRLAAYLKSGGKVDEDLGIDD